ncbi:MAG: hypothetical protein K1X72_08910 [Pyrinomonadaceae bacterium]|nr:hypothetical protein [Pyrinomonadaceae bacterium]
MERFNNKLTKILVLVLAISSFFTYTSVKAAADVVTVDGVAVPFPNGWTAGTSGKWTTSESPDKSSKFYLLATKNENFDNVIETVLEPWLNDSFKDIDDTGEDNLERNGLGLRTITYEGKRKSDNAEVTITAQFAFVLGVEPVKTVLLVSVSSNDSQHEKILEVFNNQKANKGGTVAKVDPTPTPKPVQTPAPQTGGNKNCGSLNDADIAEILKVHNAARAAVGTPPLKWNCALANFAQNWANKDLWGHSTSSQRENIIPGVYAGENLAADANQGTPLAQMMQGWLEEKPNWDNGSKSCSPGTICGHYTQMVWRQTTDIGCGINRKSSTMGDEWKGQATYLVCNYSPGGNNGNAAW